MRILAGLDTKKRIVQYFYFWEIIDFPTVIIIIAVLQIVIVWKKKKKKLYIAPRHGEVYRQLYVRIMRNQYIRVCTHIIRVKCFPPNYELHTRRSKLITIVCVWVDSHHRVFAITIYVYNIPSLQFWGIRVKSGSPDAIRIDWNQMRLYYERTKIEIDQSCSSTTFEQV